MLTQQPLSSLRQDSIRRLSARLRSNPNRKHSAPLSSGKRQRRLIRYGQAVYLIEVEDGKIHLQGCRILEYRGRSG